MTNQFSADNAIYTGVEWLFNSPAIFDFELIGKTRLSDMAQPFLFADAAYGIMKSLIASEEDEIGQLADIGLGLRLSYHNQVKGNFQLAFPVNSNFKHSNITDVDKGMKIVFDIQYSF